MSRVLVDTSVWIEMFRRGAASPEIEALRGLLQGGLACTIGLVRAEVLSGAKSERDFQFLKRSLAAVELLSDPDGLWEQVGSARYRLARRGFQAGIADLVVAVCAWSRHAALFTLDRAFDRIQGVLPFRRYEPMRH
jgi:predicted nucleic acid-binding protein